MKNTGDFFGQDLGGYKDIQVKRLMPLPDNVTVMVVDTDKENNVVMRDCVETYGSYFIAVVEENGTFGTYPYDISLEGGLDIRASFVPVRYCPKCGKRLKPHMDEDDTASLYYTCRCCGHKEKGWKDLEEDKDHE